MAKKTSVRYRKQGVSRAEPGKQMPKGKRWRLLHGKSKEVWFGALLGTHKLGKQRIAVFTVTN
jgi:hypothetical protein